MEASKYMSRLSISRTEAVAHLKEKFKHLDFRLHQYEAINALIEGKNVFLRKPTGGGKTLIYQFLASLKGKVLVISPLVALMDDQVKEAREHGLNGVCMHSQQKRSEREAALKSWSEMEGGGLLFVTPERFAKVEFREALSKQPVDFLVIDEAHCASQWGHDFRPDYSKLGEIRRFLNDPPTLACTATATEETRKDILKNLNLEEAVCFQDGVLRSNLTHESFDCFDFSEKAGLLQKLILKLQGDTLIYFSLIKNLEAAALVLEKMQIPFVKYHSKLQPHQRRQNQKSFIGGDCPLMLATPAFGLGVNKPNIRNLIHFELPGSVEAYVQEFGRAGRDGEDSKCFLLYSQEDLQVQMDFIKWGYPSPEIIKWVYREIVKTKDIGYPLHSLDDLKKKMNFYHTHDFRMEAAIQILLRWGALVKVSGVLKKGEVDVGEIPDVQEGFTETYMKEKQKKLYEVFKLIKIKEVEDFAGFIKNYFGES